MYFDNAVSTIAGIGSYGDYELSDDAFHRDDRSKRIANAASDLCDFVYEHLLETEGGGEYGDMGIFKQEHLSRIARMIAIGMMAHFEHDQETEAELVQELVQQP